MSTRNNVRKGIREPLSKAPKYVYPRPPTTSDKKDPLTNTYYEIGSFWVIGHNRQSGIPVASGTEGAIWYLSEFDASGDAIWIPFSSGGGTPPLLKMRDQVNAEASPTAAGLFDLDGSTVANGANPSGIPLETVSGTNKMDFQLQVATERTGAPGDKNDAGICSFDDTAFSVDADGYVTLAGGAGPAIDTMTGDDSVAVSPDGAGNFNWIGNTVANATHAKPVYFKDSSTANAEDLDVQVSAAITGAPGDSNDAGLCSFNDTQFTVTSDGYVALAGGADLPSIQTLTGDDSVATGPDASGNMDIQGLAVANATNAKPLYFNGGTNSEVAEIQVATEIASAPGDKNDAGICSFDSADFAVDDDGFVTLTGGSNPGPSADRLYFFDDFLPAYPSTSVSVTNSSLLPWSINSSASDPYGHAQSGHPGLVLLSWSDNSATRFVNGGSSGSTRGSFMLGGGELTIEWLKKNTDLSDGTMTYTFRCGFCDDIASIAEGCYFSYTHGTNSGNYVLNSTASSTTTSVNTSTAFSTDWEKLKIVVNSAGTSISFYIDDVAVGSAITTNISSAELSPFLAIYCTSGTRYQICYVDYCMIDQTLSR